MLRTFRTAVVAAAAATAVLAAAAAAQAAQLVGAVTVADATAPAPKPLTIGEEIPSGDGL